MTDGTDWVEWHKHRCFEWLESRELCELPASGMFQTGSERQANGRHVPGSVEELPASKHEMPCEVCGTYLVLSVAGAGSEAGSPPGPRRPERTEWTKADSPINGTIYHCVE